MNTRAAFALVTAGLSAALLVGCGSSGGSGSAASSTPPSVGTTTTATGTTAAPRTGNAVAGDSPVDAESSPAQASSTPTPPASSAGDSAEPATYTAFVGTWYGHGRTLTVDSDGGLSMDFRTYRTCSSTVTTGCDRQSGNSIIDGGHVRGMITHVDNASTVIVTVYRSTVTRDVPVSTFVLGHDVAHHALAIRLKSFTNAPFCGPGAPSGYCGA